MSGSFCKIVFGFLLIFSPDLLFGQFAYKSRSEDFALSKSFSDSLSNSKREVKIGGEIREYLQSYQNLNFGQIPASFSDPNPTQLWHRVLFNTSFKLGNHFRIFGQLNSTFRLFNPNPIVSQVDQNSLSIQQLFGEFKLSKHSILRLGKMETYFGNDRLMANREGPNNRNSYVGFNIRRYFPKVQLDAFYLHPMIQKPEFLNDQIADENISGVYFSNWKLTKNAAFDVYGMYLESNAREYLYKSGHEQRLTLGSRIFKTTGKWQYVFENAFQGGKFNDLTIGAFMSIWDVSYAVSKKVSLAFSGTYVPGDTDSNDDKLGTFNTLFAKPPFGQTVALNITNMVNWSPYIKYQLHPKSFVILRTSLVSRASTNDGVYTPNMQQYRPTANKLTSSNLTKVTDMYVVEWNLFPNKSIQTLLEFGYSKAGDYLKETGAGKDVTYIAWRGAYRF